MLLGTNPFSFIKHLDLIFSPLELKHCYFGVLALCIAVPHTLLSNQIYSRLNKVNLKYFSPVHNQKEVSIQRGHIDTITFLTKCNCWQYHKTVLFVTDYVIKLIKNQMKYRQHTALKLSKGHKMGRTQTQIKLHVLCRFSLLFLCLFLSLLSRSPVVLLVFNSCVCVLKIDQYVWQSGYLGKLNQTATIFHVVGL